MPAREESPAGQEILSQILKNADIAAAEKLALCQDTGLAVFFVELGEKVKLEYAGFKSLRDAITKGTAEGYKEGYLRKSVCDPSAARTAATTRRSSSTGRSSPATTSRSPSWPRAAAPRT